MSAVVVTPAKALGYAHISSALCFRRFLPLSARLRGEREGPTPQAWEGEVGRAADRSLRLPPPHPDPLRPQGRRGGYLGSGICACPSAKAGVQGNRRNPGAWLPAFAGMTDQERAA